MTKKLSCKKLILIMNGGWFSPAGETHVDGTNAFEKRGGGRKLHL